MADLEFNRENVNVTSKQNWDDSEAFAGIGKYVRGLYASGVGAALPSGDSSGTTALRKNLSYARTTLAIVLDEYSDACAVLGSGTEEAVSNFDALEDAESETYLRIKNRMEG